MNLFEHKSLYLQFIYFNQNQFYITGIFKINYYHRQTKHTLINIKYIF